jgi:hypothetical protein
VEEMCGARGTHGERRNTSRFLFGKPEKMRSEDLKVDMAVNITMGLEELGSEDVDWIYLAQDRGKLWVLASAVMNLRVTENLRIYLTSRQIIFFSKIKGDGSMDLVTRSTKKALSHTDEVKTEK